MYGIYCRKLQLFIDIKLYAIFIEVFMYTLKYYKEKWTQ